MFTLYAVAVMITKSTSRNSFNFHVVEMYHDKKTDESVNGTRIFDLQYQRLVGGWEIPCPPNKSCRRSASSGLFRAMSGGKKLTMVNMKPQL